MVTFDAQKDVANRRRVILKGRIVTVIDIAGRKARIAEDGKWYNHSEFFPLAEEDTRSEHLCSVSDNVVGKAIAAIKPLGTGFHFILEDNTRMVVSYGIGDPLNVTVYDSDGNKVL